MTEMVIRHRPDGIITRRFTEQPVERYDLAPQRHVNPITPRHHYPNFNATAQQPWVVHVGSAINAPVNMQLGYEVATEPKPYDEVVEAWWAAQLHDTRRRNPHALEDELESLVLFNLKVMLT